MRSVKFGYSFGQRHFSGKQRSDKIIPIEVKSGAKGQMQSMYIFLEEKKSEYGIRVSLENFSSYGKIKVYPLYAAGAI